MKIFGIIGWKNSGKTDLMERLLRVLSGRGLVVSSMKHAHHSCNVDQPGTDSDRFTMAGSREVMVASPLRWALMCTLHHEPEPPLDALLARLSPADLVLVEGYRSARHPKIETYRPGTANPPLACGDASVLAVASQAGFAIPGLSCPLLDWRDTDAIADVVCDQAVAVARPSSDG